jgi:hypothetical protein
MRRTFLLAVALFAFTGSAVAHCGDAHEAKDALSPDQQANASKVPTAVKVALPASKNSVDSKTAKKSVESKAATDKVAANKLNN